MSSSSEICCTSCGAIGLSAGRDGLCPRCLLAAALDWDLLEDETSEDVHPNECDGYVLGEMLGRGGNGVVYLAHRSGSEAQFALKMLASAHLASPDELRRFRLEAEAISGVSHPNIIRLVAVGEANGFPYFVMDYISGGNLADRLSRDSPEKSTAPEKVSLVEKIARAVHFAHERGVLHRDLKPANILISASGEPLVSDFGLARLIHAPSGMTMTGAALGTPSYMSPEQAAGGAITTSTDVFSLGAILFHLLVGRTPFQGATPLEILQQVISRDVPDPRNFAKWLDRDLATICLKSLHRDPARRYASAAVFAEDLERWQRGEAVLARPVSRPEKILKWSRRHPIAATFGLTGGVAVLALAALFIGGSILVREQRNFAQQQEKLAKKNAEMAGQQEALARLTRDESQRNSYAADMYLANRVLADGHLGQARKMLDRHRQAAGAVDLRGFEWYALERLCRGDEIRRWQDHTAAVMAVAFDPSGKILASAGRDGRVIFHSISDGQTILQLPKADAPTGMGEIPLMATVTANSSEVAGLLMSGTINQDELRFRGRPSKLGEISSLAWSPDGRHFLTAGLGSYVRLWSMPDGNLQGLIPIQTASKLYYSADGLFIFVFSRSPESQDVHELRIYQRKNLSLLRTVSKLQAAHAVSADGKNFAVMAAGDDQIHLYNREDEKPRLSWKIGYAVKQLAFSADGQTLFSQALTGMLITYWQVADGKMLGITCPIAGKYDQFFPSPDGKRIAATGADQQITHQAIHGDSPAAMLRGHEDTIRALAFSPDGKLLASGGNDHTCRLWSVTADPAREAARSEFDPSENALPDWISLPKDFSPVWARSNGGYWIGDGKSHGKLFFQPSSKTAAREEQKAPPETYLRLISSADSNVIATFSWPRILRVLHPKDGKWSDSLRLSQGIVGPIIFSPDNQWIASGGDDNVVSIHHVKTGALIATLRGHQGQINSLAFSKDGRTLASSAADQTLRLWHTPTWRELGILHQGEAIYGLTFSKDGSVLRGITESGQTRDFGGK